MTVCGYRERSVKLFGEIFGRHFSLNACLLLMFLALAGCTPPEEKAKAYYESGQKYLDEKDFVKAALEFRNALKIKQDYADAWFGMAQVEEQGQNWNLVAGDLGKVIEIDPKHTKARMSLARLQMLSGNFQESLKQVDAALALSPQDSSILAMKAAVLLKMDQPSQAIAQANIALTADPNNLDALMVLAAERMTATDFAGARAYLDRGLKSQPNAIGLHLFALNLYEKTGNVAAQEQTLRKIIDVDPAQVGYRRALASFLIAQKRYGDAEAELRTIARSNPADVQLNLDVVRSLAGFPGKGPAVAVDELKKLIESGNNSSAYKSALAQFYFELGQNEDSIALLKEVIAGEGINEAGIAARLDLSEKFILLKRSTDAEPLIAEAQANDARNVEAFRQKAAIAIERGDLEPAISDLREALNEAPGNPQLYQMMASVDERKGSIELADKNMSDAFRVSKYDPKIGLDYARFLIRRGQSEHAESLLTDVLGVAPNNVDVLAMLADLKLRRQDWQGAQTLAETIKNTAGDTTLSSQITAAAFAGQNRLDDSIRILLDSNSANSSDPKVKFSLAKAYISGGKNTEAEQYLKAILTADPKNVDAHVYLGIVQVNLKQVDLAKMNFEAAISMAPDNPIGYRALADLQTQQNQPELAEKTLQDGLAKQPKDMNLRFSLASIYQVKGDINSAIQVYEQMLSDEPGSMIAANNYASLVSDFRPDQKSIDKAAAAAAVLRGSPISQFKDTLGWILYLQGQHKEALELLKQSTADLPDLSLTNYHLGKAYAAANDLQSANESLERALKLAQTDQEKQLAQLALQELKSRAASKN